MSAIGRKCSVVNLDPANDHTSYPCALDVRSLLTIDEIMKDEELGPNGAVLYALEELEHNLEWLEAGLKTLGGEYIQHPPSPMEAERPFQRTTSSSIALGKWSSSPITHPCATSSSVFKSWDTESATPSPCLSVYF